MGGTTFPTVNHPQEPTLPLLSATKGNSCLGGGPLPVPLAACCLQAECINREMLSEGKTLGRYDTSAVCFEIRP